MTASILQFPFQPHRAAAQIKDHPLPGVPALLLALFTALTVLAQWPATVSAVMIHLPSGATDGDRVHAAALLNSELPMRCLMAAFVAVCEAALFAFLLHVLSASVAFPERPGFRRLFALAAHAALIPVLGELLFASLHTHNGMTLGPPGLAWIYAGPGNFLFFALLRTLNVLTFWYFLALGAGLRVLLGSTTARSLLLAATAWVLSMLAHLWLLRLMHASLHLPL